MSVEAPAESATEQVEADEHAAEHSHPDPRTYWLIAFFLAIVTGIEVGITYVDALAGTPVVIGLIVLGIIKFATVVGWFMHLRFEPFTMNFMFMFGLLGAIALFVIVLLSFEALFSTF